MHPALLIPTGIPRSGLVCWHDLYARYINYYYAVMSSAPVGYWRLGESSGTVAADESGNGLDGTSFNSPTLGEPGALAGDADTAIDIATGQYVQVADNALLDVTTGLTVEAWIKPDDTGAGHRGIVSKNSTSSAPYGYEMAQSSDRLRVGAEVGGVWYGSNYSADGSLVAGVWQHVGFTFNGTDIRCYVNGVLSGTPTSAVGTISTNTTHVRIGRRDYLTEYLGAIDEVAIYDRALSADEIAAHYAAGLYGRYDAFPDLSGHGNDLQLGSTAVADTNDPSVVVNQGLSFVTDDLAMASTESVIDRNGPFTVVFAAKPSGTSGILVALVMPSVAGVWRYHAVRYTGSAQVGLASYTGSSTVSDGLSVDPTGHRVFAFVGGAAENRLMRCDTGASVAISRLPITNVGGLRLEYGATWRAAPAFGNAADSLTVLGGVAANRALSNAEIQRIYRSLKATWAARGVTIL